MAEASLGEHAVNVLWVLARVKHSVCALDSARVESILLLEEEITTMPNSDDVRLGIVHYRGGVIPVLDLRGIMGMISLMAEEDAFGQMLDQRKQDHLHWVDELKRCMHTGEEFHLATDPHKCALGRWYDSYEPESYAIDFQLKKIDEPHRRLHESASEIFALEQIADAEEQERRRQEIFSSVTETCMHRVLNELDATKRVFQENSRKMVVVLYDGKQRGGVLVDEVLAVEELQPLPRSGHLGFTEEQPLVAEVAQRRGNQELVLVLRTPQLLQAQLKVD